MPWFKVDDGLHAHRKVVRAGVPAMGLWVLAGAWSADQLTDGWIPDYIAARLDPGYKEHARRLVAAGLWVPDEQDGETGWRFHQWGDHQPSAKSVLDKRDQAKERMRRVRENRRSGSQDVRANTSRSSQGSSEEVRLTPTRPDPVTTTGPYSANGRTAREPEPPPTTSEPSDVEQLIAEYRDNSPRGVPDTVAAKLAGHIHDLVAAGFHRDHIREALGQLRPRRLGPGALPTLVDEIANRQPSNVVALPAPGQQRASLGGPGTPDHFARAMERAQAREAATP